MALIDVLPKFRHKTLDLTPLETKLVPREIPIEKVAAPVIAKVATTTPVTLAPAPAKPTLTLPTGYEAFTPLAEAVNDSTITNPRARAAVVAQARLEKGSKGAPGFNYGNITAGSKWKGEVETRGDTDAQGNKITQSFRKYGSAKDYVNDYLTFLKREYPNAYAELHAKDFDIDRFSQGLVGGVKKYAQAPNYPQALKQIYQNVESNLTRTNN
jgi:hypothetical protein